MSALPHGDNEVSREEVLEEGFRELVEMVDAVNELETRLKVVLLRVGMRLDVLRAPTDQLTSRVADVHRQRVIGTLPEGEDAARLVDRLRAAASAS